MRKALNENPVVRIAVIGVVGIAFAVLLFTTFLKGPKTADPAATSPESTVAVAPPTPGGSVAPATAAQPVVPTDPAAAAQAVPPPVAGADTGAADGLLPSKGLPQDLLVAYAKDKAIALLVVDPQSLSGAKISEYTRRLSSRDDVEVFIVKSKDIADYSRITAGVAVAQTPALILIRPRKLTNSVPTASVSYGYRGPRSVDQALDDALYKGEQVTAYP